MNRIKVGRHWVCVGHEDLVLFPGVGITKRELIDYYISIALTMLPYLRNRPLSVQRFPLGINNEGFYQKNAPDYFPRWIPRSVVPKHDGYIEHVICNNQETLAYMANQATVVFHTWLSRRDKIECPDRMIFDLDPSSGDDFARVATVARMLHDFLQQAGLRSYAMLTGSRGLHVIVPITRRYTFDYVRQCAHRVATIFAVHYADLCTVELRKEKRYGRVFIDTLRNAYGQTGVAPYSVRATPHASIAVPVHWDQIGSPGLRSDSYTMRSMALIVDAYKDPWSGYSSTGQFLGRLEKINQDLLTSSTVKPR